MIRRTLAFVCSLWLAGPAFAQSASFGGAAMAPSPPQIPGLLSGSMPAGKIPYQGSVYSVLGLSNTYDSTYNSYLNVFQIGSYVNVTGTTAGVAQFGEGEAAANGARAWGGNHVGVASISGGVAIAEELDCDVLAAGGICYGLVIASAGAAPPVNAIQIQANLAATTFGDGILFNSATFQAVSGSLFKASAGTTAAFGINLAGTYSSAEIVVPSFHVGATVASVNSGVNVTGSATGNPTIAALGVSGSPATNSNLNLQGLGTGNVQSVVGGIIGLSVNGSVVSANSGVSITPSAAGNPTIAAAGASGSPAMNANLNLQGLGTGSVQLIVQGSTGVSVVGNASANSGFTLTESASGNPTFAAAGAGGSPATNSNLNLQSLGTGSVQLLSQGSIGLAVIGVASSNSGLKITESTAGNPTLAAVGAGGTPATNANLNLSSLGTGGVQILVGGLFTSGVTGGNEGVGTINATTFYGAGVVGLTCSGTPTVTFASTGGIVTHC